MYRGVERHYPPTPLNPPCSGCWAALPSRCPVGLAWVAPGRCVLGISSPTLLAEWVGELSFSYSPR